MATVDALLAVYDQQMRGVEAKPPAGMRYERDGPLLRAVGGHRGYISGPRDIGVTVDASDDSAPVLRRLGFRAVTTSTTYVWTPPQSASG